MLCTGLVSAFEQERQPKRMDRVDLQGNKVCSTNMVASRNRSSAALDNVPAVTWLERFQPCNIFSKIIGYLYIVVLAAT